MALGLGLKTGYFNIGEIFFTNVKLGIDYLKNIDIIALNSDVKNYPCIANPAKNMKNHAFYSFDTESIG